MSRNNRGGWFGGNRSSSGSSCHSSGGNHNSSSSGSGSGSRSDKGDRDKTTHNNSNAPPINTTKKDEPPKAVEAPKSEPKKPDVVVVEDESKKTNEAENAVAENNDTVCQLPQGSRHGEKKFNGRCRLFVGNLEKGTTEDDLRKLFAPFGETGEVFVNKEKGFGFIRLDYRLNAERAKLTLDKKMVKGRPLAVNYALHASAIELHGLNQFASNEFIEQAMSQFGQVDRVCIVCDDRGRSKGYAIVEFAWKKSAQKVLERFQDELFVLGRLPKPVYAKPHTQQDEDDGIHEEDIQRINGYATEREFNPRFINPNSLEFEWAKKWRDVFVEEEEKKAQLDEVMRDTRYRLEIEMEGAMQEQEAISMREALVADLQRRQEELRLFEEQMARRREAGAMFGGQRDSFGGYQPLRTRDLDTSVQDYGAGFADQSAYAGAGDQLGLGEQGLMGHGDRDEQRYDKRARRM